MGLPESSNSKQNRAPAASSSLGVSNFRTISETNKGKATSAMFKADVGLHAEFECSGRSSSSFDYCKSVRLQPQSVPEEQIVTYLSKIQRVRFIPPFDFMFVVEERSLRIIGYNENCFDLFGLNSISEIMSKAEMGFIGMHAATLFTPPSGASLAKAGTARELSLLKLVWVYSSVINKPLYAILHRVDVGFVIDLEPARSSVLAFSRVGVVQSQKLVVQAISRLHSLPGGDIGVLCDTVVKDVQRLTGYYRVMVYNFHNDEHGEIVSKMKRLDLHPYLGLHYPATDIPQAAQFLFKQNRVRMICDCYANQVKSYSE